MSLGIHFLHARHTGYCTATVDKHFVGYQSIQYIHRGAVELFYDDVRHIVEAPTFWTCYPGPHIRFHGYEGKSWNHRYAALHGPMLADWQQSGLWFHGIQVCSPSKADSCAKAMSDIIHWIDSPKPYAQVRAANLLESLLLDLAEWRQAHTKIEPWLTQVVTTLENSVGTQIDYAQLAAKCGMALSTLRRRFFQETRTSLHHYALECRIAKASRLVGTTNKPFKEIAEELGYDNVFFFSRQFRKFQGLSPLAYRRSQQV